MIEQTLATFARRFCLQQRRHRAGGDAVARTNEAYDQIMDINVKGVWLALKHEIPAMLKTGGGAIVSNSSIAGLVGRPRRSTLPANTL
jgi:NAD(P)-dependent dehydrogenase (short-subunit alcohol dehydrogenase family)